MDVQQERAKAFDRYLSPLDIWAMAFGIMVGWGVFAMPGNTFLPVAGPTGTLIAKRKQKRPPMAVFCFGTPVDNGLNNIFYGRVIHIPHYTSIRLILRTSIGNRF